MNNIHLHNRLLWHSIDAATPPSRNKGASWAGTIATLAFVGVVIAGLLWADANLVAVH